MKKRICNTMIGLFLAAAMVVAAIATPFTARADEESAQDTISYESNAKRNTYSGNYGTVITSYLVPQEDEDGNIGGYMSVQYGTSTDKSDNSKKPVLLVEYFNEQFEETGSKVIELELPRFGAFYATDEYYFVVTGQLNREQDNAKEVIRIEKYNHNWEFVEKASLSNCNTTVPFDAGSVRMDESGDYLFIRTCHSMYRASDGYCHQANMMIQLDMKKMVITNAQTGLNYSVSGYCSHSFNQFVKMDKDRNEMVTVDHGDTYPRAVVLTQHTEQQANGKFSKCYSVKLLPIKSTYFGDNWTGTLVGGLEVSNSSYVVVWSSIDHKKSDSKIKNVYVATVNKDLTGLNVKQLSFYPEDGTTTVYDAPRLVKVGDNEFNVLWQTMTGKSIDKDTVFCVRIDGKGNVIINPDADETASIDEAGDADAPSSVPSPPQAKGTVVSGGSITAVTMQTAPAAVYAISGSSITAEPAFIAAEITNCNLSECTPIVVPSNNSENGTDQMMIWTTSTKDTLGSGPSGGGSSSGGSSSKPTETTTPSATTTETRPDGTVVTTESEVTSDGTKVTKTTETHPDGTVVTTETEVKTDGTKVTKITETKADGSKKETVVETATDGSSVEKATETIKNTAGMAVDVTTTTNKDANGKVTSITQKSVIKNAGKNTSATVTVKQDGNGKVTSAKASVSQVISGKKASLTGDVIAQLKEAAGQDSVEVTLSAKDKNGTTKYTLKADTKDLTSGSVLYIYQYNTKTDEYIMVNATKYKVSKNGNVDISISKKATYKLVSTTKAAKIDKQILSTLTAKKASVSLKKGKSTTFALSSKFNKANLKNTTYTTSKNSIVSVSKAGKIKAKKEGTVTVKAKVTLKNGKTKTIKMKVTVK